MSLMSTLGKVAIGIMVAKTAGKAIGGSGGLGGLLGGLMGDNKTGSGNQSSSGGLGNLLNSLGGNSQSSASAQNSSNDLGGVLSSLFAGNEVKDVQPDQEKQAEIILKAMINAAKADGKIDAKEQESITKHIGDVTQEEIDFVKNEMQSPLDLQGVIDSVPKGMEQQVYLMSLLTIDLDSQSEASYLDQLAKGLNISEQVANDIHQRVGAPKLYS